MSIPTTSPPAFYRTKQLATNFFGVNSPGKLMRSIPRYKFMYYATFVVNSDAQNLFPDMTDLGNYEQGISFMIKSIDKPKVDLQVQELNQYNRKRYVYTRLKYNPIQIRFHDTVDDRVLQVWVNYFRYYFGDSRPKSSAVYDDSVIGTFNDSSGWGLRPVSEQINFFKRVELYAMFGQKYTQVNYINPRITNVDWQNFESEQSGSEEVNMSLDYEALEYAASGATITPELATQFGFAVDTHLEPVVLSQLNAVERSKITNVFRGTTDSSNFIPKNFPAAAYSGVTTNSVAGLFGPGSAFNNITSKINSVITAPSVFSHSVLGAFGAVNFGSVTNDIRQVFKTPTVESAASLINQAQLSGNQLASAVNQTSFGASQLASAFSTPFYPQSATASAMSMDVLSSATSPLSLNGNDTYDEVVSNYGEQDFEDESPDVAVDDIADSDDSTQDSEQDLEGTAVDLPDGNDSDLDQLVESGNPQEDADNSFGLIQDRVTDTSENPQIQNLESTQVISGGSTTHYAPVLDNYGNEISPAVTTSSLFTSSSVSSTTVVNSPSSSQPNTSSATESDIQPTGIDTSTPITRT